MTANQIKWIAVITMTIDHIGFFLLNETSEIYLMSRTIGRVAFPLFAFMIAEGYFHTKNKLRYFLRLLLMGVLFEIILVLIYLGYDVNMTHIPFLPNNISLMNISWTLMLGFLGILIMDKFDKLGPLLIIPLAIISYFSAYSFYGFGLILIFGIFRSFEKRVLYGSLLTLLYCFMPAIRNGVDYINWIQTISIFSFYIIKYYTGEKGKGKLKFFYLYYPFHIIVLFFISLIL